ncbi:MAG TPA: hypothetical protein PKY29_00220 [Ferruginibacter sp.]|nr:hypothetical protein [Ferruginibacter sp.]HRO16677.1 hypothetical protein [Ferruginibacter sp.]HRQ19701.1 hypothetical protein [Ferruginibacter sp.]
MKTMCKKWLVVILILNSSISFAQIAPRTKAVFEQAPATLTFSSALLEKSFQYVPGSYAQISFQPNFQFSGRVISSVKPYDNLQSIAIESVRYDKAILMISRQTHADNSITYTGRIMHPQSTDGYEMKRDAKGNYSLVKIETTTVLQQCL